MYKNSRPLPLPFRRKGPLPKMGRGESTSFPHKEGGWEVRSSVEQVTCPLCKEESTNLWFKKGDYDFRLCKACRLAFIGSPPPEPSLSDLYDEEYYQGDDRYGYSSYQKEYPEIVLESNRRLDIIRDCGGVGGRVVDLGCAFGFFLEVARRKGWEVSGVEWSRHSAQHTEKKLGIEVHPTLIQADFPQRGLDLVTMWEYIEHLHSPVDELIEANRILKDGGYLALSTPNMLSAFWERDFTHWKQFKPPEHLSFFTPATIGRLVENAGFKVLRIENVGGTPNGLRSLGLAKGTFGLNGLPFPLSDLKHFISRRLLGGGMIVVARKDAC